MTDADPLLSQDWYRIAHMRPRLRSGVRVTRQLVRGQTWFLLSDPVSGRHHRFNDMAYALIASCDGQATFDEVWAARVAIEGDSAPSQAEAIAVLAQAVSAHLFVGDIAPDAAAIVKRHARSQRQRRRARVNPLSFRVPLWDPERFLSAQLPRLAWLFGLPARIAVAALIALGALLLALNAGAVSDFAQRELGGGRMLLLLWLVYPVIKALHELAHAFAVKWHGGEVHEIGITLLLLTPVPYVDASASVAFARKRQRVDVAAAGIVVEALLASLALVLWLLLEPGLLKDLAFAVVFIGALSTLVVNGNPLLRFDGYFVLCDAAELPNLAARSTAYWQYLVKRLWLRLPQARFGGRAPGEWPWLVVYAPLSWAYRTVLLVLLALLGAQWSPALGLALLALAAWLVLIKPALAGLHWLAQSGEVRGQRGRAAFTASAAVALLLLLGLWLPLPQRTHAPAVVWLPDEAMVRLGSDGFVEQLLVADGAAVAAGSAIARLSNEPLQAELARVQAQLDRAQIERAMRFELDAQRTAAAEDELARLQAERERLLQRIDALTVRAAGAGRVVIEPQRVRIGQYMAQGELLAQVLPQGAPLVRALVRNEDIALVRERPGAISVRLAHSDGPALRAELGAAVPQASARLPTPALGEAAGGSIAQDPSDPSGRTAREARFQVDLKLDAGVDARIGARALVTFGHGDASAAELMARFARQSFLRYFER